MRRNIFISHSSKDIEVAKELRLKLEAKEIPGERIFVSKFAINAGDDWENVIHDAILNSRVALFLVSDHFRVSDYIPTEISRAVEQAAADNRLQIRWLKITETEPPDELTIFQGFLGAQAIGGASGGERDKMLEGVATELCSLLGPDGNIRDAFEDQLEKLAQRNFGLRLRKRLARGDNSIVFLGEGPGFRRVIKARMLTTSDEDQKQRAVRLNTQVEQVKPLNSAPFVRCTNALISNGMEMIVSDYVPKCKSLHAHLKTRNAPLPVGKVRMALAALARGLDKYHAEGLVYGNLRSRDILVENPASDDWSIRLQALSLSAMRTELWMSNYSRSTAIGWSKIEVLAPEQHENLTATKKTDQYALGLIGIEMLQGSPAVNIRSLKDVSSKERFFADPFNFPGHWQARSPRLSKIITKMLDPDPAGRYQSMSRVVNALNVKGTFAENNRMIAKLSYKSLHDRGRWTKVLASFYHEFLQGSEERRALFQKAFPGDDEISATSPQIQKLDKAILYMLNFRSDDAAEPNTLSAIREKHVAFQLSLEDFRDFEEGLLRAIETAGDSSDESRDAWRTTIQSGLEYMKGCAVEEIA